MCHNVTENAKVLELAASFNLGPEHVLWPLTSNQVEIDVAHTHHATYLKKAHPLHKYAFQ